MLQDRVAIITGASQGLGKAIAEAYLLAGAKVVICSRSASDIETAARSLRESTKADDRLLVDVCDVSKADHVERLVATTLTKWNALDVLVNNAGVYGPMGATDDVDWAEWMRAIEINLYGSVLPVRAVLPHLKAKRYGKIIQISGGGATNPLPRITAYAASKAAVVRFAESLAEEVKEFGIDVNSIAPGALNTRMMDELMVAGPQAVGDAFYARMQRIKNEGGTPVTRGAALAVFLGSSESDGLTGRLISAAWDPWEELGLRKAELEGTDIFTLRRITAADRGKDWCKS